MFDFGALDDEDDALDAAAADNKVEDAEVSIFRPGDTVQGFFLKAQWYLATVRADNGDGTYTLEWNDGDAKDTIKPAAELRLVRRHKDETQCRPEQEEGDATKNIERDQADRKAREQAEVEQQAREERERLEAEMRVEAEMKARAEREQAEKEAKVLADAERDAREREEWERIAKEAAEKQAEAERRANADEAKRKAEEDEANCPLQEDKANRKAQEDEAKSTPQEHEAKSKAQMDHHGNEKAKEQGEVVSDVAKENGQHVVAETEEEDFATSEKQRRERALQDQKKNADLARRERDKRVLERSGGRIPGVRVKLKDMKEKPHMNGACGTLVEEKGERWIVNLDGCTGVGKGKWMINRKNLLSAQWNCTEPKILYSIVGSWNNWAPADMTWDTDRQCWHYAVSVGERGWESFQFISENDPNKCVHPDQKDATPHMPHRMCGPDFEGHGQHWSVGKHPLDKGRRGAEFEVRLFTWEDEGPRVVDWSPLGVAKADAPPTNGKRRDRFCIAGTWNNWTVKDMNWDEENQHYHDMIQLTSQGWESFQILLDADYKKCMHPSISDANPYVPYTLCGPDNRGHGKNWTIGKHTMDKGSKGAKYRVRFFPAVGGRAGLVDWEPATGNPSKPQDTKPGSNGQAKRYCIAGTWSNWAVNDMAWDEKHRCYNYPVRLGLNGWESFQILEDGNYKLCIHPDCSDATPHDKHAILGPDSIGHGKNWTIGRHRLDLGSRGSRFEVRLYLDDAGIPRSVDWERAPTPGLA